MYKDKERDPPENSDYVIVLEIDIWKPKTVSHMHFLNIVIHELFNFIYLAFSLFFRGLLFVNLRKGLSVCMRFISFIRASRTVLGGRELIILNLGLNIPGLIAFCLRVSLILNLCARDYTIQILSYMLVLRYCFLRNHVH